MSKYVVDADHVTIRFNLSNEKINNLKEYAIKLVKKELMFQEFLALDDVSLKVKKGRSLGTHRCERFRKIYVSEGNCRYFEAI